MTNTKEYLNHAIERADEQSVTVAALMCGMGKSTYISERIAQTLSSRTPEGMLIVTDEVQRMHSYLEPHDAAVQTVIQRHKGKVVVMSQENADEAQRRSWNAPVLIISTQRYFRLTRKEIKQLLKWSAGQRELIMFDEKLYLIAHKTLTTKTFTDVEAALQMGIDDTVEPEDKAWTISEWKRLAMRVQKAMDEYEKLGERQFYLYHRDKEGTLTTDDDRFRRILNDSRSQILACDANTIESIEAAAVLVKGGAVFVCRKRSSGQYEKSLHVAIANRLKLLELGAKVVVLDGTGDVSPEYDLPFNRVMSAPSLKRDLSDLTIEIYNVSASRSALCGRGKKLRAKAVLNWLCRSMGEADVLFTYKELEQLAKEKFQRTTHFGSIKGRNDFRDARHIIQVGLNRFPPVHYYMLYLALNPEEKWMLQHMDVEESKRYLSVKLGDHRFNEAIMTRCLLEDVEQNFFRSAIRNRDNDEPVTFTLVMNVKEHKALVEAIQQRFGSLGAVVKQYPSPVELQEEQILSRKNTEKSRTQQAMEWIRKQPAGKVFKVSELRVALNITDSQFEKMKEHNKTFKAYMASLKTDRLGYYRVPEVENECAG